MLLLIDNYDSFTYNLVQYFEYLGKAVQVVTHDALSLDDIAALNPTHLVISPGPHAPPDAGISVAAIQRFYTTLPILGVCLGHQCLAYAFGAKIIRADAIIHGKTSSISHHQRGLFTHMPNPFNGMRYHSLWIDPPTLPDCFEVDAWHGEGIMAISHRHYPVFGLQFHPESILTEQGLSLLEQFLSC